MSPVAPVQAPVRPTRSPPDTVVAPTRSLLTVGLKLSSTQVPPLAIAAPLPQVDACTVPTDSAARAAPSAATRSGDRRTA